MELLQSIIWISFAGLLGLVITSVFAGKMELERRKFLVPYVSLTVVFLFLFFSFSGIGLSQLFLNNLIYGIAAGIIVGALLAKNVLSQPGSSRAKGNEFRLDLVWSGVVYGTVDGIYLNVIPVATVWVALSALGWTADLFGLVITGGLSLAASLLVTFLYHLGYPEFQNKKMIRVLFGNTIISLAYILSTSPIGAVLSHAIMHIAAVVQGPETTMQLPPHYQVGCGTHSPPDIVVDSH